jgi:K+/H+ antiporter YhaU regulatory subunit KhtT
MANIIVRPHVTDFFDVVTLNGGIELWVEEFVIESNSELAGQTVGQADIRRRTGVTLVSVTRHDSGAMIMPQADTRLDAGDELIVLGTREQLSALQKLTESELGHRGKEDEGRRGQRA